MAFVDDCLTTGKKVKQLREAKGFSQEHLAELVDVQRNTISNIERGVSDPGFQLMVKIFDGIDGRIAEPLADLVAALKQHIE